MKDDLLIFNSIEEIKRFREDEVTFVEEIKKEIFLRTNMLNYYFEIDEMKENECFTIEKILSMLYTAKSLIYSKINVDVISLHNMDQEEFFAHNARWMEKANDLILEGGTLRREIGKADDGYIPQDRKRLLNKYKTATKKKIKSEWVKYNSENHTVPYFLYELAFISMKADKQTGIASNFNHERYKKFCDEVIQNLNDIQNCSDIDRTLLFYKFEKTVKAKLIYGYSELLRSESKKSYFSKVEWNKIVGLYNSYMPLDMYYYPLYSLMTSLVYDYIHKPEDPIEYIRESMNFEFELLEKIVYLQKYKKEKNFKKLYDNQEGNLEKVVQVLELELKNYDIPKYNSLDHLQDQISNQFGKFKDNIKSKAPIPLLAENNKEVIARNEGGIMTKVYKDCQILFN